MKTAIKILLVILVLTGVLIAFTISDRNGGGTLAPDEEQAGAMEDAELETAARQACRNFVLQSLDEPGAAEFTDQEGWEVSERPEGTLEVTVSGAMKDALGETIEARWQCVALVDGVGARLVTLTVVETE